MDSLSSSISIMKVSAPPQELSLFKNPINSYRHHHVLPPNHHPTAATATNNLIFNKTTSFPHHTLYYSPILPPSSTSLPNKSSSPNTHHYNPATGYAAALIDIVQCKNSLQAVNRDVQNLLKFLHSEKVEVFFIDPVMSVGEKGKLVKELVKRGSFDKHPVGLVKMLIDKMKEFKTFSCRF